MRFLVRQSVQRLKWQQGLSVTPAASKRLASFAAAAQGGHDFEYDSVVKDFKWNVPSKFNFAQDVIDAHAVEHGNNVAFHHMCSLTAKERKWTYKQLSDESKQVASGMLSIGNLQRALVVCPRIPEFWLLNVAAMRTGTILFPGTTMLTPKDINRRVAAYWDGQNTKATVPGSSQTYA